MRQQCAPMTPTCQRRQAQHRRPWIWVPLRWRRKKFTFKRTSSENPEENGDTGKRLTRIEVVDELTEQIQPHFKMYLAPRRARAFRNCQDVPTSASMSWAAASGKNRQNHPKKKSRRTSREIRHCFSKTWTLYKIIKMAGASDKARFYLEQAVPQLQEFEQKKIFTRVRFQLFLHHLAALE